MIVLSGAPSRGATLKRLGSWVALAGVLGCAALAGWLAMGAAALGLDDPDDCWGYAALFYFLAVLACLAVGLTLSCLPELLHFGPVARRLARAELRGIGGRRSLAGWIAWALVLLTGCGVLLYILVSLAAGRSLYQDSVEVPAVLATIAAFAASIFLPAAVAAGTAVSLAASRRTGGAHELLMTPHAAEHLGWAAALAHARRGLLWLAAFLPLDAVALLIFADVWYGYVDMPAAAVFFIGLLAVLLVEMLALAVAAALGAWLGAAVPVPALAGMLAGPLAVGLWLARLAAIGIAAALGNEMWYNNLAEFLTWFWLALAGCWIASVFLTGMCLGLARRSLALPFAVRLGAWMVRRGGAMVGTSGERPARPEGEPDWAEAGTGAGRSGIRWKLGAAGTWVLAAGLLALLGVTAALAGDRDTRSYAAPAFWTGWAVACALALGAWAVSTIVARQLRETSSGVIRR